MNTQVYNESSDEFTTFDNDISIPNRSLIRVTPKSGIRFECLVEFWVENDKKFEFEVKAEKYITNERKLRKITRECVKRLRRMGIKTNETMKTMIEQNMKVRNDLWFEFIMNSIFV